MVRTLIATALVAAALPALAGSKIEKTLNLQPGGTFVLDADAGAVFVSASGEPNVTMTITSDAENLEKLLRLRFTEKIGQARVDAKKNDDRAWMNGIRVRYEVRVPAGTALDLRTPQGDLRVPAIDPATRVVTTGGRIALEGAGAVRASR
jgi:hypothetical protein